MKKIKFSTTKKIVPLLGIASIMFCFSVSNVSAETSVAIPETITLNIQKNHADIRDLPKDKKSVNNFTHQKHAQDYLKGNGSHASTPYTDEFTCTACHNEAKSSAELTGVAPQERLLASLNHKGGPGKVKNYFHDICLACHKSMKKAQLTTGPTKCNGCHKRE